MLHFVDGLRKLVPGRARARIARAIIDIGYVRGPRLMSWFRKRWAIFRNPLATISFDGYSYLGPGFSIHAPQGGSFIVGRHVEFRRNFRVELADADAVVRIGDNCFLTYDVIIACSTSIDIGKRVGISQAYIVDGSHNYRELDQPFLAQGYTYRPLTIADDVAIHAKATIIADIGERAVIAANAVVTKPVPAFTVAGGVPARILDYFGPPGEEPECFTPRLSQSGSLTH